MKQFLSDQLSFDFVVTLLYLPGFSYIPVPPSPGSAHPWFPFLCRGLWISTRHLLRAVTSQEREMIWRSNPGTGQKVELKLACSLSEHWRNLRHGEGLTGGSQDVITAGSSSCPSAPPHLFSHLLAVLYSKEYLQVLHPRQLCVPQTCLFHMLFF